MPKKRFELTSEDIDKVMYCVRMQSDDADEEYKDNLAESVYEKSDFKRNVEETAKDLDIPIEIVDRVIKHYIRSVIGFMFLIHTKYKIIITVYTLMFIDLENAIYQPKSQMYYKYFYDVLTALDVWKIKRALKRNRLFINN